MKRIDTWELAKGLQRLEIQQLMDAVKDFGGKVTFADRDDADEDTKADVWERPCVMVNADNVGPVDAYINSIEIINSIGGEQLNIIGIYKEDFDEVEIDETDIAVGHIGFITELIPDKQDHGEPCLINKLTATTVGGEWLSIDTNAETWEYQSDANDDDTYISGCYETDNNRPCTVTGYDGCFNLPRAVCDALKRLGYILEL